MKPFGITSFTLIFIGLIGVQAHAEKPRTSAPTGRPALRELAGLQGSVGGFVCFSPDGSKILTTSSLVIERQSTTIQIWDAKTFQSIGDEIEHRNGFQAAEFDAPGTKLLTFGCREDFAANPREIVSGEANLWDAATGKHLLGPIRHGSRPLSAAALSPDGKIIATCLQDDSTVRLFDADNGKPLREFPHAENIIFVQFDSSGTLIAGGRHSVTQWDAQHGNVRGTLEKLPYDSNEQFCMSFDRKRLAVRSMWSVVVYDLVSGKKLAKIEPQLNLDEYLTDIHLSADGSRLATQLFCVKDDSGQVWDVATEKPLFHINDSLDGGYISPDGKKVLFEFYPLQSVLYDVATGDAFDFDKKFRRYHGMAAFSPDGKRIAISSGGETAVLAIDD